MLKIQQKFMLYTPSVTCGDSSLKEGAKTPSSVAALLGMTVILVCAGSGRTEHELACH